MVCSIAGEAKEIGDSFAHAQAVSCEGMMVSILCSKLI